MEDIKDDIKQETGLVENKKTSLEELNEEYLKKQVASGKTISEIGVDFAKAKITSEIINNENGEFDNLHKDFAKEQTEAIKEGFKQDKIKSQTQTLTEKQKQAEAFYISFRPILEFDFGNLVRKEETKKDNSKEEKPPKTYEDRSYGIPLMVIMLSLLLLPYCFVTIILSVFNGINAVFMAISTFTKIAKVIVLSLFIIAIVLLVVYFAMMGIDALFGTNILNSIGL